MSERTLPDAGARRSRWQGLQSIAWPLAALAAILLFNLLFTRGFFSVSFKNGHLFGSLIDILKRATPVMIISMAMTLVIATGGIDISVGSIAAIGGTIAVLMLRGGDITYLAKTVHAGTPLLPIVLVALLAALACGLFNGFLVAVVDIQPIIATLILMVTGRGLALLITEGYTLNFLHPGYSYIGTGYLLGLPFSLFIAVAILLLLVVVTRRTPLGLFIQSTGGNSTASFYTGVNTRAVKLFVYAVSGLCAGTAGIVMTSDIRSTDPNFLGLWLELDAILAVVIGGTSMNGGRYRLVGTVIGALIIQSLTTTILTRGVPVQYTLIVKAVVVTIVLLLQSERTRELLARRGAKP